MRSANTFNTRAVARALLAAATAVAMTACGVAPPAPEDHYYRLPPPNPGEPLTRPLVAGKVGVAPITARGLYQERAILFTDSRRPLELDLYNYHFWVQSPSHLIQAYLIDYLRAAKAAVSVTRYEPGATADGTISGHIDRFERIVGGEQDRVTVALDLHYAAADRPATPAFDKRYEATVPVRGRTMDAVVTAFGTALDRIGGAFVHDLAQASREGRL